MPFAVPFIVEKSVEKYLNGLLPARDPVLREMEARARREHIPIIGPACGRLLALLAETSGARQIFEMGSAIGYSTIWLARAVGSRGEVHYTDNDPARMKDAQNYFRRAGVARRVHLHLGDAVESLKRAKGSYDYIFCDVDKEQYADAFRVAMPRLRRGGLFVADNVLWHGLVARRGGDATTHAIQKFNRTLYASHELLPVILPLRDGVAVARKR